MLTGLMPPLTSRSSCSPPTASPLTPHLCSLAGAVAIDERERADMMLSSDRSAAPQMVMSQGHNMHDAMMRGGGTKVPLKMTSLNFEMMAGLPMDGGAQGLGVGPASGAPHSAGALGGGPQAAAWNPMSQGHDSFFLPAPAANLQKQLAQMPGASARKMSSRQDVTQTHFQMLDPREMARNGGPPRR